MIVIESSPGISRFKHDDFKGTVRFYDGVIHFTLIRFRLYFIHNALQCVEI